MTQKAIEVDVKMTGGPIGAGCAIVITLHLREKRHHKDHELVNETASNIIILHKDHGAFLH